jgi:formylmethanofuran dehydrogenase subunit E
MTTNTDKGNIDMDYQQIVSFHGHDCPGLAIGYRMASAAMEELYASRSEDEEIVAIVENNACGVDALQCLTGCTFGKGNLIFHDYGKQVYTLFSRASGSGVRVLFRADAIPDDWRENRKALIERLLKAPREEIIDITRVSIREPAPARIHRSLPCASCGELVMETRLRETDGKRLCIPCAETKE